MEGHDRALFQGDLLVPTQGPRASLREDVESPGREDCFVNRTALPVEVMIIVVIFNTFMTKEAEGAALCGVWGQGLQSMGGAGVCSPAHVAESLHPPCLPAPGGKQERLLYHWAGGTLRDIWPGFPEGLSSV